jgi:haloalkane dehalogenase
MAYSNPSLYPFESRWWDRRGIKLHYLDEGKGEPVVMVHGNPSWSFYYRNLAQALRGSYRVIVPDHVGMGLSEKPADGAYDYVLKSRVDDLEGLLDHLAIRENVTLVVHDWGGMIGMAYACRRPERIKRLVVLNTAAFPLHEGKALPWQLKVARGPLGPLLVRGMNAFSAGAIQACVARKPLAADVVAGYLAPYDSWDNRRAVLRFVEDIPIHPGEASFDLVKWTGDNLHKLSALPMLIAWGGKDFVFDADFFAEWRKRFPRAEVKEFPDAGHYVLEDAGEEIAALVKSFLKRNPLESRV